MTRAAGRGAVVAGRGVSVLRGFLRKGLRPEQPPINNHAGEFVAPPPPIGLLPEERNAHKQNMKAAVIESEQRLNEAKQYKKLMVEEGKRQRRESSFINRFFFSGSSTPSTKPRTERKLSSLLSPLQKERTMPTGKREQRGSDGGKGSTKRGWNPFVPLPKEKRLGSILGLRRK